MFPPKPFAASSMLNSDIFFPLEGILQLLGGTYGVPGHKKAQNQKSFGMGTSPMSYCEYISKHPQKEKEKNVKKSR